jgi:hypothetical protein
MKLVRIKAAATTSNMIAVIPLITFVKYSAPIKTAIAILIIRSINPMFVFMIRKF